MPTTLYFVDGPNPPTEFSITIREGESLQIGRIPPCQLVVRDPMVSSKHATIEVSATTTSILDHDSRNGTIVNGEKISQAKLRNDDQIQIGKSRFRIAIAASEITATVKAPAEATWNGAESTLPATTASYYQRPDVVHLLTSDQSDGVIRFRFGQTIVIGASRNSSDFAFKNVGLHRRHFKLKCREGRYFITALSKSDSRTLVNEKEFLEIELFDGDKISAGQIEFVFSLQDHHSKISPTTSAAPIAMAAQQASPTPSQPVIPCELDTSPDGLDGLFTLDGKHDVHEVALLLSKQSKFMVLIDFLRSGVAPNDRAIRVSDESVTPFGSYLTELESPEQQSAMIESAWNRDAMVILISQLSLQELADRLIQIRNNNRSTFNLAWPSNIRGLLGWAPPDFFDALYECVDAMMLETEAMEGWQIYSKAGNLDALKQMGFQFTRPTDQASSADRKTT